MGTFFEALRPRERQRGIPNDSGFTSGESPISALGYRGDVLVVLASRGWMASRLNLAAH